MFAPTAIPSGSQQPTSEVPLADVRSYAATTELPPDGQIAPPIRPQPSGPAGPGWGGPSAPEPAPPVSPSRSRLAVAAVAFVLGGVVGAGGFALGAQTNEATTVATESSANPIADVAETIAQDSTTTTLDLPVNPLEPAAAVALSLSPSVVQVETEIGQGSGVVYADGLILTNHHVVVGATEVRIRTAEGLIVDAEVLGSDPRNDIAVLSVPEADLPVAAIGSSSALQPGQVTVAIGSPFQLQQTVTAGIVSSVNRPVPNDDGSVTAMIQTDAPINPGNSGGALANINGELVGINTSIRTDGTSNSNVGIGFAVPIDTAIAVAHRIESGQSLAPGVLGVSGSQEDADLGVPIDEVTPGSGADLAGLAAGDRVLSIDGIPITTIGELAGLIQSHFTGEVVELEVVRGAQELTVEATLS